MNNNRPIVFALVLALVIGVAALKPGRIFAAGETDKPTDPSPSLLQSDITSPTVPIVVDDGDYTSATTTLHASWSSMDPDTGICEYQYAVGTSPDPDDLIVPWKSAGTDTQATESALTLEEGKSYFWYVKAKNCVGLWSLSGASNGITIDTQPPVCDIKMNGGLPFASSPVVTLALPSTDAVSGVALMRFRNSTDTYQDWKPFVPHDVWALPAGDGPKTVFAEFQDKVGNTSQECSAVIGLDTLPPTCGIDINNGAALTNNPVVTLALDSADTYSGIAQMRFGTDGHTWLPWESYNTSKTFTLPGPDGTNTVYVRFKDNAGNITDACSDDITLDTTPPSCGIIINGGQLFTSDPAVTLALSSTDTLSGLAGMQFSEDNLTWGALEPFAASRNWTFASSEGLKKICVRFQDTAGNVSDGCCATITLDTVPPDDFTPTADPTACTNAANVTITFSTTDAGSGIDHYELAVDAGAFVAATSPHDLDVSALSDGQHTVHVKAIDKAGNSRTKDVTITLDKTAPTDLTAAANPGACTKENSISITFSATDAGCGIDHYELALDGGGFTPQVSPYSLDVSAAADGAHTVHVKVFDKAGNSASTDVPIVLDKTPPTGLTAAADPSTCTNGDSISITFSATDAGCGIDHYEVALDGGSFTTQASPYALNVTSVADGLHTVHVKAFDKAGNSVSEDVPITLDKTPPTGLTAAAAPSTCTNGDSISITFSATDAGCGIDHYEIALDGGSFTTQASPYPLNVTSVADGLHTVHVKAFDKAGNSASTNVTITLDKTPPEDFTPVVDPANCTSSDKVTITFSSTDIGCGIDHYELAVDAGAFATVTSPYDLDVTGLTDGAHTVHVKAIDNAGNSRIKDAAINIDKTPPTDLTVAANPNTCTRENSISITFSAVDAGCGIDHYEVALDAESFTTQVSPYSLDVTSTSDGVHTVQVKAFDKAGNSATKVVTITLDKTAPVDFTPTANPAGCTKDDLVIITFGTSDAGCGIDHYEVALDAGSFATQTSPYALNVASVGDGAHTVHVKAVDKAGNSLTKDVPVTLDKTPPTDLTVAANPNTCTRENSISITFSAVDAGCGIDHYEVALDGGSYTTQASPYSLDVTAAADGAHTVHVKAFDKAGNSASKDVAIMLDKTPPASFTAAANPAVCTKENSIAITFSATDTGCGIDHYEVALDAGSFTTQASPYSLNVTAVPDGSHTVHVKAIDKAGNSAAKDVTIILDKTAPLSFTPIASPSGYTNQNIIVVTFSTTDAGCGIDHYEVALDAGSFTSRTSPYSMDVTGVADGTHTVHVKAIDKAGNTTVGDATIKLDRQAPSCSISISGAAQYTSIAEVTLALGSTDGLSGLDQMQLRNDADSWTPWEAYTASRSWILSSGDGAKTVYVKFKDKAGNESAPCSVAITLDTTAPTLPVVTDDGDCTKIGNSLHASWTSTDPGSEVVEYKYAIGTSATDPGAGYLVDWKSNGTNTQATEAPLALVSGQTYYWYVKAKNGAGLWSSTGVSDGIRFDLSPPSKPVVNAQSLCDNGLMTIRASWTTSDDESSICEYKYAITLSPTAPPDADPNWTSVQTDTPITASGLSIPQAGEAYYCFVKARNCCSSWSEVGRSEPIQCDTSPPSTPVVTDDGDFVMIMTELHAKWISEDKDSGIEGYWYAIGTSPTPPPGNACVTDGAPCSTCIVNWTWVGPNTETTRKNLSLIEGKTYYWYVQAKNGVGLCSAIGVSNGITVGISPDFRKIKLVPATPGRSYEQQECLGALGSAGDPIKAVGAVLQIVPGDKWSNFIPAALHGIPYTIKNVELRKQTPRLMQCVDVFPPTEVVQQGTVNIRKWWPLIYEIPGTTWTLNILYATNNAVQFAGEKKPGYVHMETWTWELVTDFEDIQSLLSAFRTHAFGASEVPLISDDALYLNLWNKIQQAHDSTDNAEKARILADFEMTVAGRCISAVPTSPNAEGPTTGIAQTVENPACCALLGSVEYVLTHQGIAQPHK